MDNTTLKSLAMPTSEQIAKRIVHNREQAENNELNFYVREVYLDFARSGEEILIGEANRIIEMRKLGL